MPPRSVLHVVQASPGGVPNVAAGLVANQIARGWRVAVACPPALDLAPRSVDAGARYLPWPAQREAGPSMAVEAQRLRSIVAAVRPELVHLHSSKAGLVGRALIRGRRPTVFQPHAWSFEAARGRSLQLAVAWERFAVRWANLVVCVSDDECRRGQDMGVRARSAVVPNGIDLSRYAAASEDERSQARRSLGLFEAPTALVVGRIDEQKGQDVLLDAWPAVLEELPHAELVLVGDGPRRSALEDRKVPRARFAGWAADVRPWLAAADVVAFPSLWEGGPLAPIEAMARGRAVVTTEVGGMGTAAEHGAGALVPVGAAAPLAAALLERLRDPGLADREGAAGRALAERRFAVSAATERIAELYDEVLERHAASGRPLVRSRQPVSP